MGPYLGGDAHLERPAADGHVYQGLGTLNSGASPPTSNNLPDGTVLQAESAPQAIHLILLHQMEQPFQSFHKILQLLPRPQENLLFFF